MTTPSTKQTSQAGRRGPAVRSDCWVRITLNQSGGIALHLKSKVESMYGDSIRSLVSDMMAAMKIKHARVELEDAGALPFVLMARIEAAVRGLAYCGNDKTPNGHRAKGDPKQNVSHAGPLAIEYLPPMEDHATYQSTPDRFRRSRLYLPGNSPKFMLNAGLHRPDGIILDLEDSVAPSAKDQARLLVRNALRSLDFYGAERMVRINQGDRGIKDLDFVIPHNVHVVLIPKVESADQVQRVDQRIGDIQAKLLAPRKAAQRAAGKSEGRAADGTERRAESERERRAAGFSPRGQTSASDTTRGTKSARAEARGSSARSSNRSSTGYSSGSPATLGSQDIFLMPIIESALGVIHAYEIATASPNVVALTIGLEDYTADIGTDRTLEGRESLWARSQVVNAAHAAGVQPIDSVFSDVSDMDALRISTLEAKSLGFEGKGCIHPRQIAVVHEAFAPSPEELEKAMRIVAAYAEAQAKGIGVVSLGSKMIDAPVVKRAQRVVRLAKAVGMVI